MGAALLLLAALTGPQMLFVTDDDFPFQSKLRHETGGAAVLVTVSPRGKTLDCTMIEAFGAKPIGPMICDLLRHRRFEPARLADGTPAYSRLRMLFRFELPRKDWRMMPTITLAPDLGMADQQLPPGDDGKEVAVLLAVDPQGRVVDCRPNPFETNPEVGRRVCLHSAQIAAPALMVEGKPVAYVIARKVRLSRGK